VQASKVVSLDWYRSVVEEVNEGSMVPYVPVFALYGRRVVVAQIRLQMQLCQISNVVLDAIHYNLLYDCAIVAVNGLVHIRRGK